MNWWPFRSKKLYEEEIDIQKRAHVMTAQQLGAKIAEEKDVNRALHEVLKERNREIEQLKYQLSEATRICDLAGCRAAVVRKDDGSRVCAAGHVSRWVERTELTRAQEMAKSTWDDAWLVQHVKVLRRLLWLRHGCPSAGQYGDDGEMQCAGCGIDFKRAQPSDIEGRFVQMSLIKLAEAQKAKEKT